MIRILTLFFILFFSSGIFGQDFYDINRVQDIKITFSEQNWAKVLDSLKLDGNKDRLVGSVTINGMRYDSVGVRYKGNSSYFNVSKHGSSKLPFNIKINYKKKQQKLPGNYTSIKLSNVFRDPSFIREALSYEIARDYMPAPKANFARVYVNNELLGLYNSVESINNNFVTNHYGTDDGILIKCDPEEIGLAKTARNRKKGCGEGEYASLMFMGTDTFCYEKLYELKDDAGWKELIQMSQTLAENPDQIDQILNVDQVLWMHAFNNVLVNMDSYSGRLSHNYYMYQDTFGIFQPIIWDLNLSFGGFRFHSDEPGMDNEQMKTLSPFLHYKNPKRPLISQVLSTGLYRKVYIAHIHTILRDHFSNNKYLTRINDIQRFIDFYVSSDKNKLYEYDKFKLNIDSTVLAGKTKIVGIKELMQDRTKYLSNHPILKKEQPKISAVSYATASENLNFTCKVEGASSVYLMYLSTETGRYQQIKMKDDGAQKDGSAGDMTYGISLPKGAASAYYIIGEAEKTAQVYPEKSSFAPLKIQ